MTDHAFRRPAPDLLQCRPDAPARVREALRAVGVDPEPFVAAAGLDATPTRAAAAARAYALAVEAAGAPWLGLAMSAARTVDWLAPLGAALPASASLAELVTAVSAGLDRLVEGQRLVVRWRADATHVVLTLPAGLDPRGKDVILAASATFAARLLVTTGAAPAEDLRVVSPVLSPVHEVGGVRVVDGPAWGVRGPPDLLRQPIHLGELVPATPPPRPERTPLDAARVAMLVALPTGARLGDVARALGMAPRTLQAHLGTLGTSFSDLLAAVRADVVGALDGLPRRVVAREAGYRSPEALARFVRTLPGR